MRRLIFALLMSPSIAFAETPITFHEALAAAKRSAPEIAITRANERTGDSSIRAAGLYPNPTGTVASNTHGPYFSAGVSVPLQILGQIGAGKDAARAAHAVVEIDTAVAEVEVRMLVARAYTRLWLAEGVASARRDARTIAEGLERAVAARVEVGAAAEIDELRVRAEKLRAGADAASAEAQTTTASIELGRLVGVPNGSLRTASDPVVPDVPPTLEGLLVRIGASPAVVREEADARAFEARASHERALARPGMALFFAVDGWYPKAAGGYSTEYRVSLSFDLPIWNWRVANVDHELAQADVARTRASVAKTNKTAELRAGYQLYEAANARVKTLGDDVLPATEAARKAAEGAYGLGRSSLVAVLDAARALVETKQQLLEARAARADAWARVEHAVGSR